MKIGIFFHKYPLFIGGSYYQEFLNKLVDNAKIEEIYIISQKYPHNADIKVNNKLKICWISFILTLPIIEEVANTLLALIKVIFIRDLHKINIYHSFGPRGILAGCYLKLIYKIPFICTIEIVRKSSSVKDLFFNYLMKILLKIAPLDKCIICSYFHYKYIKKCIPTFKIDVVPLWIDTEKYRPQLSGYRFKKKYAPHTPLIVFAKPLYKANAKAAEILIQSVAYLYNKFNFEVKLLLFKTGKRIRAVKKIIEKYRAENLVCFEGPIPFEYVPYYLAASDIIVLPFVYPPTTSRSLLEALSMGKPIITNNKGEIPFIVSNNKEALVVEELDVKSIAIAIKNIISNHQLASNLGRNARRVAIEKYDVKMIINKVLNIYSQLLHKTK